jgi:hypothetical protein
LHEQQRIAVHLAAERRDPEARVHYNNGGTLGHIICSALVLPT